MRGDARRGPAAARQGARGARRRRRDGRDVGPDACASAWRRPSEGSASLEVIDLRSLVPLDMDDGARVDAADRPPARRPRGGAGLRRGRRDRRPRGRRAVRRAAHAGAPARDAARAHAVQSRARAVAPARRRPRSPKRPRRWCGRASVQVRLDDPRSRRGRAGGRDRRAGRTPARRPARSGVARAYEQLAGVLRERIASGALREGDRLPSETLLAAAGRREPLDRPRGAADARRRPG